eukprot:1688148-Rhodomonas_salina.1
MILQYRPGTELGYARTACLIRITAMALRHSNSTDQRYGPTAGVPSTLRNHHIYFMILRDRPGTGLEYGPTA